MIESNMECLTIRIFGISNDSIVDGPGIRYVIFTQGCFHNCPGCHNPESHSMQGGYDKSIADILQEIDDNPLLDGITLSGGEPMEQVEALLPLLPEIKKRGLSIVIYSGYTYEQIIADQDKRNLLSYCDILIDGKYLEAQRSLALLFRGSKNQRMIDIQSSMQNHKVILYDQIGV